MPVCTGKSAFIGLNYVFACGIMHTVKVAFFCHGSAPLPGAIQPQKGQIAANRSLTDFAVLPNVYG